MEGDGLCAMKPGGLGSGWEHLVTNHRGMNTIYQGLHEHRDVTSLEHNKQVNGA